MKLGDLSQIAKYADAIGIAKALATPEAVSAAHALNLRVHVWTFRAENEFLPDDLRIGTAPAAHGQPRGGDPAISGARHRRVFRRFSRHRRAGSRCLYFSGPAAAPAAHGHGLAGKQVAGPVGGARGPLQQ